MATFLTQSPAPGAAMILHAGDSVTFRLELSGEMPGTAFLRTNLRQAARQRAETIAAVEEDAPPPGLDWEDLPMLPDGPRRWTLTLPLTDVGVFEGKAFLHVSEDQAPVWPDGGGNTRVKVEPAWTVAGNSIYAAFPRLFRDNSSDLPDADLRPLDNLGYTVIPPSGTFRDVTRRLDHILGALGFRIVLVLPPFLVPTTHARMGRYGSPFAALDFKNVDPALAEFDHRTTPLQQFREMADGIHARGARLFIDIPINHTGWASQLMAHHPEWFVRNENGTFHSPGAWGVVWADLVKLDYAHKALWREMAEVFLYWCRQGVDGFRCDAGYFVPAPVWRYISAKVRTEFPDTVFFLEGLGGPIPVMLDLLAGNGLNWAYSELFQNESRGAMDWYLPQAIAQSRMEGYQINIAETHDNSRLAAVSPAWAKLRQAVAALCSPAGGWGLTCGGEWLATEQIRVHGATSLNEGAEPNLISHIAALQELLKQPAFEAGAELQLITRSSGSGIALRRISRDRSQTLLVLINLDTAAEAQAAWLREDFSFGVHGVCFLTGEPVTVEWTDKEGTVHLAPGRVVVLCAAKLVPVGEPPSVRQETAALARRLALWLGKPDAVLPSAPLTADPAAWCRELSGLPFAPLTTASWPQDQRREVVWLPGDLLMLTAPGPFRYSVNAGTLHLAEGLSLPGSAFHFAIVPRPQGYTGPAAAFLRVPGSGTLTRGTLPLLLPPPLADPVCEATGAEVRAQPDLHLVLTNGTGAMVHTRAAWGTVRSQYDSLLAANPHPDFPVDRRMMLNRCRLWLMRRGFSTEVCAKWMEGVKLLAADTAEWCFCLPCGDGQWVRLTATVHLTHGRDAVCLRFVREPGDNAGPVTLIARPDVEDRAFHDKWTLPDHEMPHLDGALSASSDGFAMPCHAGTLTVRTDGGAHFVRQAERMTVDHAIDASRGLGAHSDLFSPGYFQAPLVSGERVHLTAVLTRHGQETLPAAPPPEAPAGFTLQAAVRQFIVKRDDSLTVIAGYPWFLDWGRDTLICLRGIAAAGEREAVRDILRTFARYEHQGTLPNMIRGGDDSNRDTSDAPLWFFTGVEDLLEREGSGAFLDEKAGGRTIREVLISLGQGYAAGTPNGIRMDPETGLIYSPPHFTWMDTNFPAGTPREGYPIEIQALWFAALRLLARIDSDPVWARLAGQVRNSLLTRFTRPGQAYLSDCLHAASGQSAASAVADDHLRPNQLLAITLGAVTDPTFQSGILTSCLELLIPGALRTLADRPVVFPLPVERHGQLLNDPHAPFQGHYEGDEDTRRKPAYHNGTGWPWLMPMLAEAMMMVWGEAARPRAAGILASSAPLFRRFSLGSLEEVVDGAWPHAPRGCGSQAWSVTEWARVRELLEKR
ncbi:MAG: glgE2 [Verrucomicrobiales bacterium]|nr:glgE2 [Verrucomicrobiales bacterium]